jgi:hypothetical protein
MGRGQRTQGGRPSVHPARRRSRRLKSFRITYTLLGDSVASNVDPFATTLPAAGKWLTDGRHTTIFGEALLDACPHTVTGGRIPRSLCDTGMPYAHLMVPVTPP